MDSINQVIPFAPLLFGGILTAGVVYILAMIFLGGLGDAGLDVDVDGDFGGADVDIGTDISADIDGGAEGEAVGISLNVIAAFCVGVGAIGLVASLSNWSLLLTLLSSILFGLFLGRFFQKMLQFVLRQQHSGLIKTNTLVGVQARITVNTPAGKLGEALLEEPERMKYPVKHIHDEPLEKGDIVTVVEVKNGRLIVRKQATGVDL